MKKKAYILSFHGILCTVYLCVLGVALPLTVHDAYFDITRTKAMVFWILSSLVLIVWLTAGCIRREICWRSLLSGKPVVLFAVFTVTHILSTLLFQSSSEVLTAPDNRFQGVLSFALYFPIFLILRRDGHLTPLVRFALLLGSATAALIGILNVFGADPLGLLSVSPAIEHPRFLSTVGNISFFGALCVLMLPLASYYALSSKDFHQALPYALCALLFLCGGMAARTEGFLLGALAFLAALPLFCRDTGVLRRIPLLWATVTAAALLFYFAMLLRSLYRPSDLTRFLCSPAVTLPFILLTSLLFLLLRQKEDEAVQKARKVYIIIFWFLLAALAVFVILANTILREGLPDSIASAVVFSPSWGTDRGAEWMSFWQMYRQAPFLKKIIGSGAGSVAAWDRTHRLFSDAVTDSAHSEYLHYLLTGGLLGLLAYLALLVFALLRSLRSPSRARTAIALSCFAYAIQAAVNIAQPFTTPLFFSLLALLYTDDTANQAQTQSVALFFPVALCALSAVLLIVGAA